MACKMLIRTRQGQCKAKLAVAIRVILFFGIPITYMLILKLSSTEALNENSVEKISDQRFSSRRLLGVVNTKNCTPAAILEFPSDSLTRNQRQHGYIIFHCILAIYCFILLSAICEHFFVPAIKILCKKLNMAEDIAGATFMAAASSSPELFINCVGTFVTEGDLGVGAVVGSAVFNVLAVPAFCGLLTKKLVNLDWWSVSRDCMVYAVAVVALILTLLDNKVYWHEALLLVCTYALYIIAMVFNKSIGNFVKSCCGFKKQKLYTEITPLLVKDKLNGHNLSYQDKETLIEVPSVTKDLNSNFTTEIEYLGSSTESIWSLPNEKGTILNKLYWVLTWPIHFLLWATVPDCRKSSRLCPLTFLMCLCWIASISYLEAWIITILGDTFNIPDSITGLTFLAAGTSLPEAVSSVVVTKQGYGSMGISNSIGSNTFDILLCLGLPWLVKALFFPVVPGNHWIAINSGGITYSAISLLTTLILLYGSLALNKFRLDWKVGVICAAIYILFLIIATLIELNVFFVVNLPVCPHD